MDWRGRRYFAASFMWDANWHIHYIATQFNCTVHPCTYAPSINDQLGCYPNRDKFTDELKPRGYYQVMIGCHNNDTDDALDVLAYLETTPSCQYREVLPK